MTTLVPCKFCGDLSGRLPDKRCDRCWEVAIRLGEFVSSQPGRAYALHMLGVSPGVLDEAERRGDSKMKSKTNLELACRLLLDLGDDGPELRALKTIIRILDEAERRGAEAMRERAATFCAEEAAHVRGLTGLKWDAAYAAEHVEDCRDYIAALPLPGGET